MRGVEWTRSVWTFREDQRRRGMQRPLTHTSGPVWAAPCRRESYPEGGAGSTARWSATAVTSQKRLFSAKNHAASRQSHGARLCDSSISARALAPIRIGTASRAQRRVMPMTVRMARRCRRVLACLFRVLPLHVLPLHVLPLRAPPPGARALHPHRARGPCLALHGAGACARSPRRTPARAGTDAGNGSGERHGGHKQGRARHAKAARGDAVLR